MCCTRAYSSQSDRCKNNFSCWLITGHPQCLHLRVDSLLFLSVDNVEKLSLMEEPFQFIMINSEVVPEIVKFLHIPLFNYRSFSPQQGTICRDWLQLQRKQGNWHLYVNELWDCNCFWWWSSSLVHLLMHLQRFPERLQLQRFHVNLAPPRRLRLVWATSMPIQSIQLRE